MSLTITPDMISNKVSEAPQSVRSKKGPLNSKFDEVLENMADIMPPATKELSSEHVASTGGTVLATAISSVAADKVPPHINPHATGTVLSTAFDASANGVAPHINPLAQADTQEASYTMSSNINPGSLTSPEQLNMSNANISNAATSTGDHFSNLKAMLDQNHERSMQFFELQSKTQKHAQIMSMKSNVAKAIFDAKMSTLRNIRGGG